MTQAAIDHAFNSFSLCLEHFMKSTTYRMASSDPGLPLIDWYLFLFDLAAIARQRFHGRLTCAAIKKRLRHMRGKPGEVAIGEAAALLANPSDVLHLDRLLYAIRCRFDLDTYDAAFPWPEACLFVRAISPESLPWRMREEARFLAGNYTPVPWAETLAPIAGHFAHLSAANPGLIAFTDTAEKGEADIQTPMKPGRYLAKFYPQLADHEVRDIQEQMPRTATVYFAVTADDIERVYTTGPSSCMSHEPGHFDSPCHPVRVYGDSDLQLAYLKSKSGVPSARALVWPEKKLIGRTYGHGALLRQQLGRDGYRRGSLAGARIRRIDTGDDEPGVVMPYIDDDQSFDVVDANWLAIGGTYAAGSTTGVASLTVYTDCARCENRVAESDTYEVTGETWCESCRDNCAFASDYSGADFPADEQARVLRRTAEGSTTLETWSTSERDELATYCDGSGEWYATADFIFVRLINGQTWAASYFVEHGKPGDLAADNENPPSDGAEGRAAA
jgi:hypothetical protein